MSETDASRRSSRPPSTKAYRRGIGSHDQDNAVVVAAPVDHVDGAAVLDVVNLQAALLAHLAPGTLLKRLAKLEVAALKVRQTWR